MWQTPLIILGYLLRTLCTPNTLLSVVMPEDAASVYLFACSVFFHNRRRNSEGYSPGHDDDKVKLVPPVAKVTIRAENSQCHHLDDHFHREESKDTVVQDLKERTDVQGGWTLNTVNRNKG